jgi:2-C-methyl-D-erythritol 2,4-cyclodiphosphate synthase
MRIGYGYDVHRFEDGGPLILGGVEIPFEKSLSGHSDADVLLHAITDALFGACALGDLGKHFPDTSEDYEDIDSRVLLRDALGLIEQKEFLVGNVDATVVAEKPKLAPYINEMRQVIARDLKVDIDKVSVKATTSEGIGFEGRAEGISARAVVLLVENE